MQIKSFFIESNPKDKSLAELQDKIVNEWLVKRPDIRNVRISVSADLAGSFGKSVVILSYEGQESKGAK